MGGSGSQVGMPHEDRWCTVLLSWPSALTHRVWGMSPASRACISSYWWRESGEGASL